MNALADDRHAPALTKTETDTGLLHSVLERDERAWREFVGRYDADLRQVVRHAAEAIWPLDDDQIQDVLGDFWLRMVANDFRMLRAFDPSRPGAALFTWLTFQVAHVAHEYIRRMGSEPETVPLAHARNIAAPAVATPMLRQERAAGAAERALLADLADFLVTLTLAGKLDNGSTAIVNSAAQPTTHAVRRSAATTSRCLRPRRAKASCARSSTC